MPRLSPDPLGARPALPSPDTSLGTPNFKTRLSARTIWIVPVQLGSRKLEEQENAIRSIIDGLRWRQLAVGPSF